MAKKNKDEFEYQGRSAAKWKEHAQESAGNFDRFVRDGVNRFTPKEGNNRLRILPPYWKDAEDWAYNIFIHYGVGPDEQSYLCPKEMKDEECPVCEEQTRLNRAGETEDAKAMKASKRFGCWVIDRKAEDEGPQFWSMPFTIWREANISAEDEDGAIREFDHPTKGFDLLFKKEGTGLHTKYLGIKLATKKGPVSVDVEDQKQWLGYVKKNKVPDILKFYDANHIEAVFGGTKSSDDDEDLDDKPKGKKKKGKKKKGKKGKKGNGTERLAKSAKKGKKSKKKKKGNGEEIPF